MPKRERPDSLNTVSMADAARILSVSRQRVGELVAAGRLETHPVEGWVKPRLLRSDVERFRRARDRGAR